MLPLTITLLIILQHYVQAVPGYPACLEDREASFDDNCPSYRCCRAEGAYSTYVCSPAAIGYQYDKELDQDGVPEDCVVVTAQSSSSTTSSQARSSSITVKTSTIASLTSTSTSTFRLSSTLGTQTTAPVRSSTFLGLSSTVSTTLLPKTSSESSATPSRGSSTTTISVIKSTSSVRLSAATVSSTSVSIGRSSLQVSSSIASKSALLSSQSVLRTSSALMSGSRSSVRASQSTISVSTVRSSAGSSVRSSPSAVSSAGCPSPLTKVNGLTNCVNLKTDPANCGKIGNVCPRVATSSSTVCTNGVCDYTCKSGLTKYNNTCIDTSNNPQHCGSITKNCTVPIYGSSVSCVKSKCVAVCTQGRINSNGDCITAPKGTKLTFDDMSKAPSIASGDYTPLPSDYAGYTGWSNFKVYSGAYGNGPNLPRNYIGVNSQARLAFAPSILDFSVLDNLHNAQQIVAYFRRLPAPDYSAYASDKMYNLTGLPLPITLTSPFGAISGPDNSSVYRYYMQVDSDQYIYPALDNLVVP